MRIRERLVCWLLGTLSAPELRRVWSAVGHYLNRLDGTYDTHRKAP